MAFRKIKTSVRDYYELKLRRHGPTPLGVDWKSLESQSLRFEQLMKICDFNRPFSITDIGCGYGALYDFLEERGCDFTYLGFDLSEEMVKKARALHVGLAPDQFSFSEDSLHPTDYAVASGIFNVKMETPKEKWRDYLLATLDQIAAISNRGFSFNVLTSYSDPPFMRDDLYYADPLDLFHYCKTKFSKHVALLHDYPLYEFTILVRM